MKSVYPLYTDADSDVGYRDHLDEPMTIDGTADSVQSHDTEREGFSETWSRPIFAKLRWQVPLIVLVNAIFPAILVSGWESNWIISDWHLNTFVVTAICPLVALLLFRRLEGFPGIASLANVLPSVLVPYGGALVVIIALRFDYSRPYLLLSAFISLVLFAGLWVYHRRRCTPTVYVVPGARLDHTPRLKIRELVVPPDKLERNSIVAADLRAPMPAEWDRFILNAALAGTPVFHSKSLQESILGKVEIEHLSENTFGSVIPSLAYLRLKRMLDLSLAVMALPFLVPLVGIIAIAIRIDSPGSVFFLQDRMGFRGRSFVMVKFRTMKQQAPSDGEDPLLVVMTQPNDERVTRVGRFLRRFRLDELPQLFNVLRGQMSWIGPRPEAAALSDWYKVKIPFYEYRHMVRPGITGWAQVNQGHVVEVDDVKEKLNYDFYYIKHFSAWLDLLIVFRTMRTLLIGGGAK